MRGTRRSRTAQGVAAERALLTELGVLDDPYARSMLGPTMGAVYRVARRWPQRVPTLPVTLAGLAARVRWHDDRVLAAIEDGIRQVVVVGAGYDSRAWRLRHDGVTFFELDHPATQRDKRRVAPGTGPVYVEADLRADSAGAALVDAGLDPARPALFVLEGVTMYLAEDGVRDQLTGLHDRSDTGSRLTTDVLPPADGATVPDRRQLRMQRLARAGSGETLHLRVDRDDAVALVEACGWSVDEAVGARTAARALVPPGRGLPVDAIDDRKTLLAAVRH